MGVGANGTPPGTDLRHCPATGAVSRTKYRPHVGYVGLEGDLLILGTSEQVHRPDMVGMRDAATAAEPSPTAIAAKHVHRTLPYSFPTAPSSTSKPQQLATPLVPLPLPEGKGVAKVAPPVGHVLAVTGLLERLRWAASNFVTSGRGAAYILYAGVVEAMALALGISIHRRYTSGPLRDFWLLEETGDRAQNAFSGMLDFFLAWTPDDPIRGRGRAGRRTSFDEAVNHFENEMRRTAAACENGASHPFDACRAIQALEEQVRLYPWGGDERAKAQCPAIPSRG